MSASRFISGRLKVRERTVMASIAVSFLVIILAVSISGGFRYEIRRGLSQMSGDIQLSGVGNPVTSELHPIASRPSYMDRLESIEGVESITPVIYRAGIIKKDSDIQGIMVKGLPDSLSGLGAVIPSKLADLFSLKEGDRMNVYFIGETLKARNFTVRGIYQSTLDTKDNLVIYAGLSDLQRLNGWSEDEVSALEITLEDRWKEGEALRSVTAETGWTVLHHMSDNDPTLFASSVEDRYPQLFQWLALIDTNVLVILILMTIVAGFNMISGLLIILFRNTSTIGTLKSMGMTDREVGKVFLSLSAGMLLKAMAAGNALAFLFCFIQGRWHLIKLNAADYFVPYVPVRLDIPGTVLADAAAFAVIMLLLLIPSIYISKIDPAKTMKAE